VEDRTYVYVQDENGVVYALPDAPHRHPRVLGLARPAMYAGDLTVNQGKIIDLTNLSGTFQCDDPDGLLNVAAVLRQLGFEIELGAVRFFPIDGSRPVILG
jgi:hypothetical protein